MENNMQENFKKLERRVIDTLNNTDLERINYELSNITEPTLVSGVGGSRVVSEYASKIISSKNNIITRNTEPRDFKYMNIKPYKNVLVCSYSGRNYGVDMSLDNDLKHYLLANKKSDRDDVINLNYNNEDIEDSFISLGATIIPCSILLNYYLDNDKDRIIELFNSYNFNFDTNCDAYEIFSGYETATASEYLESTMLEAGIGIPIVHDKYDYCHGRSTLSTVYNNVAIYFNGNTDLDKVYIEELNKYYKDVVVIDFNNNFINEFELLLKCMYLTKYIAEEKEKDLTYIKYSPIAKRLYRYKGEI